MRNFNIFAVVVITFIMINGLLYKEATAQIPLEKISQLEEYENYLRTGNYKVTAFIDSLGEKEAGETESWINNINHSSYYLSDGQLMRIDAPTTGTSILFLESGTYLLDSESGTYALHTNKTLYPEIAIDLEKNNPEVLQIYSIFLKSIQWIEHTDYTWESGEPVIVKNNEETKLLKVWLFLYETDPLLAKLTLIDENGIQQEVTLQYEIISNEEIFEATNFSTYTASLL